MGKEYFCEFNLTLANSDDSEIELSVIDGFWEVMYDYAEEKGLKLRGSSLICIDGFDEEDNE